MRLKLPGLISLLTLLGASWLLLLPYESMAEVAEAQEQAPGREMARQATKARETWITADHTKHKALQQEFKTGSKVTEACLSCHSEAAEQFQQTIHWTWLDPNSDEETLVGKGGHSVNNFCVSTNLMNDKSCLDCHAGWNGKEEGVNCLVCHGQKDFDLKEAFADVRYFYESGDAESLDLAKEIQGDIQEAVQSIGRPTRKHCGSCHFYGGGGDGVKHGDLDSSMTNPDKALDVHMDHRGKNFQCVRCHTTRRHHVAGRVYSTPAVTHRRSLIEDDLTPKIMCESCHTNKPYKSDTKANDHTDKVACQSCHIPEFARGNPTKTQWDWSKAGKRKDGKPYKEKGPFGKYSYLSIKGEMKWEKNVEPEYFWFNGAINTLTVKDVIDPNTRVRVSWPVGSHGDENSRIFPFKVHRGRQPYDKVHKRLLGALLSGEEGYWNTLDWQGALTKGMEYLDMPYSGQFDFVDTSYVFPTTHQVAPKDQRLACNECHAKNGRLANLAGFYMPGRDASAILDFLGWLTVIGAILGVLTHGAGRLFFKSFFMKRKGRKE